MKKLGVAFVLSTLAVSGLLVVACGGDQFDSCEANANCPPSDGGTGATGGTSGTGGTGNTGGTSGTGATGGTGGDSGSCDLSKSPSSESCLIDDQYAVFASPTGSDSTGDGTKDKPFGTLGKALSAAATAGKVVLACDDGTGFTESATLEVSNAHDGHGMYGGFDCANWAWSASAKAKVNGAAIAMTIDGVATGFTVESFDIKAANAAGSGESSFGAIVTSSKGVVFQGVNLTAGDGKAGDAGGDGTQGADGDAATATQNGAAATCTSAPGTQEGGKWPGLSTCGSKGGAGGTANKAGAGEKGSAGIPQTNVTPANVDNGGAIGVTGTTGSKGDDGALGTVAASTGAFVATGFTPADGNPGDDGHPGQGGGGGGASSSSSGTPNCIGASGGAGGMGGCGGGKGTAGKGGGASVALMSWQSAVTLTSCSLTASKGGDGGKGGDAAGGGTGKTGGSGGPAASGLSSGGPGGLGGDGGSGGSGSGGTGGPSYAMVWNGTKPTATQTTLKEGTGGALGAGGKLQGSGLNPAPGGTAGDQAKEFEQK